MAIYFTTLGFGTKCILKYGIKKFIFYHVFKKGDALRA